MKRVLIAGIAASLLAIGFAVMAMDPFQNPKVVQALGLTSEQQQSLEALRFQQQKEMINLRRDMALKRLDLEQEMDKAAPDRQVVDRLLDEQGALRSKIMKARVNHLLDMRKVLTPEQWAKAKAHFQAMRAARGAGRRGQGGFNRGCDLGGGRGMGPGCGMGQGMRRGGGPGSGRPAGPPAQGGPGFGPGAGAGAPDVSEPGS